MTQDHVNLTVSTATGVGAFVTPESLLSWGQKAVLGVVIGVLTSLTMRLIDKLWRRVHSHK